MTSKMKKPTKWRKIKMPDRDSADKEIEIQIHLEIIQAILVARFSGQDIYENTEELK